MVFQVLPVIEAWSAKRPVRSTDEEFGRTFRWWLGLGVRRSPFTRTVRFSWTLPYAGLVAQMSDERGAPRGIGRLADRGAIRLALLFTFPDHQSVPSVQLRPWDRGSVDVKRTVC